MRIVLGLFLLGIAGVAYPQTSQAPFTITVGTDKPEVKVGDPVDLKIEMKNISDHDLECGGAPSNALDRRYGYDVVYEDGQAAPKVVRNHPEIGETGSIWRCVIKPGETATAARGRISQLYDFSRPGKYSIQVWRHEAFDARSDVVRSNTLEVTVVPAEEQSLTQAPGTTFSLTLSAPNAEVALGANVFVTILQTNLSDRTIDCSAQADSGVDYNYKFDVRDQHGTEAAKVVLKHPELVATSYQGCTLPPRESRLEGLLVNRVYQFNEPGEYTIQVSRLDEGVPGRVFVKSNIVTITVLPEVEQPSSAQVNPPNSRPTTPERESRRSQATPEPRTSLPAPPPEKPRFALSIEEDKDAARSVPGLHRVIVKYTDVWIGAELDYFYKEALERYNMIVERDGVPVAETNAMRALRNFRKADIDYYPPNQRVLQPGESWTDALDVSDFYDMSSPGTYQVTVTRESLPLNLAYSVLVRSNTIAIVVPPGAGAADTRAVERPRARFSLTLSNGNPDEFPVVIRVERRNVSETVIREAKCWPFAGAYNVFVSRNGAPLELTADGREVQKKIAGVDCPGNETLITIDPGESEEDEMPLSFYYDIEGPGAYTVYVTRETYPWNPAKSVLVESNTIYFLVPEPAPAVDAPPAAGAGLE
jgi:hypothetical protein